MDQRIIKNNDVQKLLLLFITAELGLEISDENMNRHKAYIQSWISVLEKNPNELFKAIRDADLITNYIKEKEIEFILQDSNVLKMNLLHKDER